MRLDRPFGSGARDLQVQTLMSRLKKSGVLSTVSLVGLSNDVLSKNPGLFKQLCGAEAGRRGPPSKGFQRRALIYIQNGVLQGLSETLIKLYQIKFICFRFSPKAVRKDLWSHPECTNFVWFGVLFNLDFSLAFRSHGRQNKTSIRHYGDFFRPIF